MGRVRSLNYNREHILSQHSKDGYMMVQLYKNNKVKKFSVHRLVLLSFIGNPEAGMEASHKNGIRDDNRLDNLCWESHWDNEQRKIDHGTTNRKLNSDDVSTIRRIYDPNKIGYGCKSLSERYNVSKSTISDIVKGRSWKGDDSYDGEKDFSDDVDYIKLSRSLSKLTDEEVRHIRSNYKPWCKFNGVRAFSIKYGLNEKTIRNLINRKSYKWVS